MNSLPHKVSSVTTSRSIDGTPGQHVGRDYPFPPRSKRRAGPVRAIVEITVDPRVMAAARSARRAGEKMVLVDAETVLLVPEQRS